MNLKHTAVAAILALGLTAGTAQAALIVDISQVGSDVVAVGQGTLNLDGLTDIGNFILTPGVKGDTAYFGTGRAGIIVRGYSGISGPLQIGTGGFVAINTDYNGDTFSFGARTGRLFLEPNVAPGSLLGFDTTWAGATIASLGLTNGSYTYTLPNDSFTINIGKTNVSAVPLPASAPMFGAALLALAGFGYGVNRRVAPTSKTDVDAVAA